MRGPAALIALVASLALNVFLIGAGAAVIFLGMGAGHGRPAQQPALRHAALSLDAGHRPAFVAMLRAQGRGVRPANQRARALRLEAWGALAEPSVEPAAIKARLAQARALNLASRASVENAVVDFAAALPLDQRAALSGALRHAILQNAGQQNARAPAPPSQ